MNITMIPGLCVEQFTLSGFSLSYIQLAEKTPVQADKYVTATIRLAHEVVVAS